MFCMFYVFDKMHPFKFCTLRRSLLVLPTRSWEEQGIIRKMGTRAWEDVDWDGMGHRTPIYTELGTMCRYHYLGMVIVYDRLVSTRS
jgi:hypothetical protein